MKMNMTMANMFFASANAVTVDGSGISSNSTDSTEKSSFMSMLGNVSSDKSLATNENVQVSDEVLLEDFPTEDEMTFVALLQDFSSFVTENFSEDELNILLEKLPIAIEKLKTSGEFEVTGNLSLTQKACEILGINADFADTALQFYKKLVKITETATETETSAKDYVTGIFEALSQAKTTTSENEADDETNLALASFVSVIYRNIISDETEKHTSISFSSSSEQTAYTEALPKITAEEFITKLEAGTVVTFEEAFTQLEKISKKLGSFIGEAGVSATNIGSEITVVEFVNEKSSAQTDLFSDFQSYKKMSLNIVDAKDAVNSIKSATENISEENVVVPQHQSENNTALTEQANTIYKELSEIAYRQLEKPILESISSGKTEFTAILKPENLGEIAVKITENAGGEVSIILSATNSEVAKALTLNAGAVASELAKMNVDVDNINVVNPSDASSYMNLDFSNEGFNRRDENSENTSENTSDANAKISEISDIANAQKLLKEAKLLWQTA